MFNHRIDHPTSKRVTANWLLLGFNGGFINAGGFLATGRFVSHVTGFATLFGVDFVRKGLAEAIGILSVPLFFLAGATLAGLLIDRQILQGRAPHYDYVMALSCAALLMATLVGSLRQVIAFGSYYDVGHIYVVLASLCLACGLQNAALTSSSGSSVRTTHLTGLTTDLGLGIARFFSFGMQDPRNENERRANKLRLGTIVAFVGGSTVGAVVFEKFHYLGFLIPAVISAYAALHGRKFKYVPHKL